MKLCWFAVLALILAVEPGFGSSGVAQSAPPSPGLDVLTAALEERDELERTYLLTSYLRSLVPESLPAALAEIEKHRVGVTEGEVRLLMLAWTRFDGPGAFKAASEWPTG